MELHGLQRKRKYGKRMLMYHMNRSKASTKRAGAGSWIQKERIFHHSTGRQWRYSLSHDRGSRSG